MSNGLEEQIRGLIRRVELSEFERGILDDARVKADRIEDLQVQEFQRVGEGGGYTLIEEKTPSAVTNFTFSSIPADFRHLEIWWTGQLDTATANPTLFMRFNGDASCSYNWSRHKVMSAIPGPTGDEHLLEGLFDTEFPFTQLPGQDHANTDIDEFGFGTARVNNYASDRWKGFLSMSGNFFPTASRVNIRDTSFSGRWQGTAAITSIKVGNFGAPDNFVSGTKFSLYGVG